MLDPYPFGGCNTSLEAFDLNIPVVTMPTKYLNGRFTFGMYKKMGFIDMVADSAENYVKIAIKAGVDVRWRDTIKEKINRNKILLFQEIESVNNWDTFFTRIYNEKHNKIIPTIQQQIQIPVKPLEQLQLPKDEPVKPLEQLQLPKDEPVKPINLESWAYDVKESNINMDETSINKQSDNDMNLEQQETNNNTNLEINDNDNDNDLINTETINQILDEVMQENLSFDTFIENT
jgi:hypothetical protein